MHALLSAAEETTRELPVPPVAVGIISLAILLALLLATLSFGKGREHS